MKRMNLTEVRNEKKRILDHFAEFCESNGIKYSIAYGTMLGAIRHGGWIPWDDDVDVILLREEWDRFFNLYDNEQNDRFKVVNNKIDQRVHTKIGYMYDTYTHMKPRNNAEFTGFNAIQIDIYPLDCIPAPGLKRDIFMGRTRLLGILAKLSDISSGNPGGNRTRTKIILASIICIVMKPFNASWFIQRQTTLAHKYDKKFTSEEKDNNDVNMLCTNIRQMPIVPYSIMTEHTKIDFEGTSYCMIKDYDTFLKARYGKYMDLPPEGQRNCYTYNTEEYYIEDRYYEEAPKTESPYVDEWC